MKTTVVYIFPRPEQPHFDTYYYPYACRFVSTYLEHAPGGEADVAVVSNGGEPTPLMELVFAPLKARFIAHDNVGWDIGGYLHAAYDIDCDLMVFFGSPAYFVRGGWLARMQQAFAEYERGLYGSFASLQMRPHLRTIGFWCSPTVLRQYGAWPKTKEERYEFEHGENSLTSHAIRAGYSVEMVTWDGRYGFTDWRKPDNVFWRGDQSSCLIRDNYTDRYDVAHPWMKQAMERAANGQ